MADLQPDELQTIKGILTALAPDCEARAFGSRVPGPAKKYADLDLALLGPQSLGIRRLAAIKEAFEESTLPFRVDLLDYSQASVEFKQVILKNFEVLKAPDS